MEMKNEMKSVMKRREGPKMYQVKSAENQVQYG